MLRGGVHVGVGDHPATAVDAGPAAGRADPDRVEVLGADVGVARVDRRVHVEPVHALGEPAGELDPLVVGGVRRAVLAVHVGRVGRRSEVAAEVAHRLRAGVVVERRDRRPVVTRVERRAVHVVEAVGHRDRGRDLRRRMVGPVVAGAVRAAVAVVTGGAEHRVEELDLAVHRAVAELDRVVDAVGVVVRVRVALRSAGAVAEVHRVVAVAVLAESAGGEGRAPDVLRRERRAADRVVDVQVGLDPGGRACRPSRSARRPRRSRCCCMRS